MHKILIIGSEGQIGTELTIGLAKKYGHEKIIASDIKSETAIEAFPVKYYQLDILDGKKLKEIVLEEQVKEVYLLAALLSATAEKNPSFAWELNMQGLFNVLNLAKEGIINKVFWPSSIAVFGPSTPKDATPQQTIMEPTTVYGISKQAGEQWCHYYHKNYGVDVRSIRYPGLISYTSLPGGGTTDYAVDIFYHAKANGEYTSFLEKDTALPMMFMEDAIRATIDLMSAPADTVIHRNSYNIAGFSFTPDKLAQAIKKKLPEFKIDYAPDFRQKIADTWPNSIDDSDARKHWGWNPKFDLEAMVEVMLENVNPNLLFQGQ